jgi:hypothetical protein
MNSFPLQVETGMTILPALCTSNTSLLYDTDLRTPHKFALLPVALASVSFGFVRVRPREREERTVEYFRSANEMTRCRSQQPNRSSGFFVQPSTPTCSDYSTLAIVHIVPYISS